MGKKKIFNDPLYGLIQFPFDIVYKIIEHPYFQRLRRIGQMGLAHYVYPGATHTRFQHTLGATHLMNRAITTLRGKGVEISEAEHRAVNIAILMHDIGHGPFSHALEGVLLPLHHEILSLKFIDYFESNYSEDFSLTKAIFENKYERQFLHQLVSSQLDVDRMDYLNRDSFYTGVIEGKIGYDRILSMLNVVDGKLVIEQKGIYSVEKFLISRYTMYWQVYLHKTAVASEQMLKLLITEVKKDLKKGSNIPLPASLLTLLSIQDESLFENTDTLEQFGMIDDYDLWALIKRYTAHEDKIIRYIANGLLNRRIFETTESNAVVLCDFEENIRQKVAYHLEVDDVTAQKLIVTHKESKGIYNEKTGKILILTKDGTVANFEDITDFNFYSHFHKKEFLCYPRL